MNVNKCLLGFAVMLLITTHNHSVVALAQTTAERRCANGTLKEGPVRFRKSLRLGRPAEFDDGLGISIGRCYPLYVRNKLVIWVNEMHAVGSKILVRHCTEDASVTDVEAGARGGHISDDYGEIAVVSEKGKLIYKEVSLPLWSVFANPAFCGSTVAYWGVEGATNSAKNIYAVLFDLNEGKVLEKQFVGAVQIESDSRSFFSQPAWKVSVVTFNPGRVSDSSGNNLQSIDLSVR